MIKKAIRMKLHPGYEAEYEKRHRELWPELMETNPDDSPVTQELKEVFTL